MDDQSRQKFQQHLFEAFEFRLEITPVSESLYPPIIRDVRKEMGPVIGYFPRRLLNIVDESLAGNFQSLKIATSATQDGVSLELATSQHERCGDICTFGADETEQLIGTLLIHAGEEVLLSELAQFGIAPMRATVKRVAEEEVVLSQLSLVNYTTGLQITQIRKKADIHLVTLKNISAKTIRRYSCGVASPTSASDQTMHTEFAAGVGKVTNFHLSSTRRSILPAGFTPPPEPQTFVIGAVMYADNSCEGKGSWLCNILFDTPRPRQRSDFMFSLLRRLNEAPENQLMDEIAQVRHEIQAYCASEIMMPPNVTLQGRDWKEEEMAERAFLSWMRTMLEKAIRMREWQSINDTAMLNDTRRASMNKAVERSRKLLELFPLE